MNRLGKLARLTKRQTNRLYFSKLPVGTLFVVVDEVDLPAYNLTGHFIDVMPQILSDGSVHCTGYIERGSWEILGSIEDNLHLLKNK